MALGLLVIAGCHGASTTTTKSFTVNCTTSPYTTAVSIDLPAWTDPNEDIPIGNVGIVPRPVAPILGPWSATFAIQGATSPLSFTDFTSSNASGQIVDPTVKTVHVTAPAGGQVVVSLDSFTGVLASPNVGRVVYTCTPAPGSDATVGTIPVHGGSSG